MAKTGPSVEFASERLKFWQTKIESDNAKPRFSRMPRRDREAILKVIRAYKTIIDQRSK